MPIDKISDIRRLPRLGKIRLGIKKEGQRGTYPSATDYFVCPEEVKVVYKDQPKELDIMFPADDLDLIAPQWYKCYSYTQGLVCKGDGKSCRRKVDVDTGDFADKSTRKWEMWTGPCIPEHCPKLGDKQCRRMMSLLFILPDVPGLGVYQLDTSSFYSIVNINSQLAPDGFIRQFTRKRIAFIPLKLSIGPQVVNPPGEGRKTVNVLNVRADVKLADIIRISRQAPTQVLLPTLEEETPPDDLYPDEVIGGDMAAGGEGEAVKSGVPTPQATAVPATPPAATKPSCSCPKPVPSQEVGMKPDGTYWHVACGGYLCAPPIDCFPGCPHIPIEGGGETIPEGDEKIGGEPEIKAGGEGKAAPTILSSPKSKTEKAAESAPGVQPLEAAPVGEGVAIDLAEVKHLFKTINWTENTAKSWIASHLKVDARGSFTEVLQRLTREQANKFIKELQDRAARVQPGLFD